MNRGRIAVWIMIGVCAVATWLGYEGGLDQGHRDTCPAVSR